MGSILRLLILAGIVWLIYAFIKRALTAQQPPQNPPAPLMHQCAHCGVYVAPHEVIAFEGLFFCSEPHKQLYLQRKP